MRNTAARAAAAGGVVGPVAFIGGWVAGAATTDEPYSSLHDAISRLAAVGADRRGLMTAGFVGFGIGLPLYAWSLRRVIGGRAWTTAAATGLATLAVAATPLERSDTVDTLHAIFAGAGYVTLAATPLLAARPLRELGHRRLAVAGVIAGAVSAASLALTTTSLPTGLFQRLGLTVTDVWVAASALATASGVVGRAAADAPTVSVSGV
jgi:hypothetical protein